MLSEVTVSLGAQTISATDEGVSIVKDRSFLIKADASDIFVSYEDIESVLFVQTHIIMGFGAYLEIKCRANTFHMDSNSKDFTNQLLNNPYAVSVAKNKIDEARAKLACHIGDRNCAADEIKGAQADFIDENGKVLLTQMTAAGG